MPSQPVSEEAWILELVGGSRLRGSPGPDLPDSGLPSWRLALQGEVFLPFDSLWLRAQGRGSIPEPRPLDQDQLWLLRPGGVLDLQRGFLLDWRAAGAVFETSGGARTVPWPEVHALSVLEESLAPPRDGVWLFLADGSALTAKVIAQDPRGAEGSHWEIELPWGAHARIPASAVSRVRRREAVEEWANAAWTVSEQPSSSVLDWSPKLGRSVDGHALRLGARTWPDGLGVKAPSTLTRRAPGAGLLMLTVGADARVADFRQPQPIVFRVLLDGVELASTPPLGHSDAPRTLRVAVPHAGLLSLRAETATEANQGAHANWCDLIWLAGE